MSIDDYSLEQLDPVGHDADIQALAELLTAAVREGEALSFLTPLDLDRAVSWWRQLFHDAHDSTAMVVCRYRGQIVATVQMQPAWAPNQPHRAEVLKLIVHRDHRRRGLARRLMLAVEKKALSLGRWLLTLDAKKGGAAAKLYQGMGWIEVGSIPEFALDPDGVTPHDATIFYKDLR